MSTDEYNNHKNFELFRYYISRDIDKLDRKIEGRNNELFSYILASLVDVVVVMLFQNDIAEKSILIKIVCVIFLIAMFVGVYKASGYLQKSIKTKRKESGLNSLTNEEEKQRIIDEFDNIACDGLLICENYLKKYKETDEDYLKKFYLYEVVHHLNKAVDVFEKVYTRKKQFIQKNTLELIDVYRANNFIDFSKAVLTTVNEKAKEMKDKELEQKLKNLDSLINNWKYID